MAAQCLQAAQTEDIPESEIEEAFDDLAAFIGGEIEEARARDEEDEDDEDDDDDELAEDGDEEEEEDEEDEGEKKDG